MHQQTQRQSQYSTATFITWLRKKTQKILAFSTDVLFSDITGKKAVGGGAVAVIR
jgi:hypothetical protein